MLNSSHAKKIPCVFSLVVKKSPARSQIQVQRSSSQLDLARCHLKKRTVILGLRRKSSGAAARNPCPGAFFPAPPRLRTLFCLLFSAAPPLQPVPPPHPQPCRVPPRPRPQRERWRRRPRCLAVAAFSAVVILPVPFLDSLQPQINRHSSNNSLRGTRMHNRPSRIHSPGSRTRRLTRLLSAESGRRLSRRLSSGYRRCSAT